MALDAGVVCRHVVHLSGIQDVGACGMGDVLATGTVAAFAADIPFRHLLGVDVVVDGVAAIAGRAGRPLDIVRGIENRPPISSGVWNVILQPLFVADVPLNGKRVVVGADFGEVSLFPLAAIDESHLVFAERGNLVCCEVRNDRIGMFSGSRTTLAIGVFLQCS